MQPPFTIRYRVTLNISPTLDLYHAAAVFTGLADLATAGTIQFQLATQSARPSNRLTSDEITLVLDIEDRITGKSCTACIDLRDRSDCFSAELLRRCTIYFKRGYFTPDIQKLPDDLGSKIQPFGLNFCCRSSSGTKALLRTFAKQLLQNFPASLHPRTRHNLRHWLTRPLLPELELPPDQPVNPTIFFQTRLWEQPETEPDRAVEVNKMRVAVVRALKKAFGQQFVGGLQPTMLAQKSYPELLTDGATTPKAYLLKSRNSLIGIYTRGLHHSLAFKLGEYLATSKCIITDILRHELPTPMKQQQNYLDFSSADECVARCQQLLTNPQSVADMRFANWQYYCAEVRPAAHMLKCLERACT